MPASFRELGPSYRLANPEGLAQWEALEKKSAPAGRVEQKPRNALTWAAIESIRTPALCIAGAADLYMPAPLTLEYASHLRQAEAVIVNESGHSAYWEQPIATNRALIDFLRRNAARRRRHRT
jgi:pimeloyl-ACP methyl ester carboxylesterase